MKRKCSPRASFLHSTYALRNRDNSQLDLNITASTRSHLTFHKFQYAEGHDVHFYPIRAQTIEWDNSLLSGQSCCVTTRPSYNFQLVVDADIIGLIIVVIFALGLSAISHICNFEWYGTFTCSSITWFGSDTNIEKGLRNPRTEDCANQEKWLAVPSRVQLQLMSSYRCRWNGKDVYEKSLWEIRQNLCP